MKICKNCNKKFSKNYKESRSQWNKRLFCKRICFFNSMKGRTMIKFSCVSCNKLCNKPYRSDAKYKYCNRTCSGSNSAVEMNKIPKKFGTDNPAWKGGITPINRKLRTSTKYKQWQTLVFQRDNFTCQMCKKQKTYLHADHIKSFANFPDLRFDLKNGRTLCRECHYLITFKKDPVKIGSWGMKYSQQYGN